jgi:hypothetical protein
MKKDKLVKYKDMVNIGGEDVMATMYVTVQERLRMLKKEENFIKNSIKELTKMLVAVRKEILKLNDNN